MSQCCKPRCSAFGKNSSTAYQVIVGKGAAFEGIQGQRLKDFTDGTSNTILIVEAAIAVPWTTLKLPHRGMAIIGEFLDPTLTLGVVEQRPRNLRCNPVRAATGRRR
jgi:hypothetical protein